MSIHVAACRSFPLRPRQHQIIPLTGKIDVFSLRGRPAYYTSISLGTSRGAPHQNQHLGVTGLTDLAGVHRINPASRVFQVLWHNHDT
jgi:hypothetical protein